MFPSQLCPGTVSSMTLSCRSSRSYVPCAHQTLLQWPCEVFAPRQLKPKGCPSTWYALTLDTTTYLLDHLFHNAKPYLREISAPARHVLIWMPCSRVAVDLGTSGLGLRLRLPGSPLSPSPESGGGIMWTKRPCREPRKRPREGWAGWGPWDATRYGEPLPRICWMTATTSGRFRNCTGIGM